MCLLCKKEANANKLHLISAAVVFQLNQFLDQATVAMNGRERSQIINE